MKYKKKALLRVYSKSWAKKKKNNKAKWNDESRNNDQSKHRALGKCKNHRHQNKNMQKNKKRQHRGYRPMGKIRAPIEECNYDFMQSIEYQNGLDYDGIQQCRYRFFNESNWIEREALTKGKPFYSKNGKCVWQKPEELIDNEEYDEIYKDYAWKKQIHYLKEPVRQRIDIEPFKVSTNTYPIQLNESMNVLEYAMIIVPKPIEDELGFRPNVKNVDVNKLFKRFGNKNIVKSYFDPYIIDNGNLFTFANKQSEKEHKQLIEFPSDFAENYLFSFQLKSARPLHYFAGVNDDDQKSQNDDEKNMNEDDEDDEVSPERRVQIFQFIMSSILSQCGFKFIKFRGVRGWYPSNSNSSLNRVESVYGSKHTRHFMRQIGVLRGFKTSIAPSTNNSVVLKVSNVNKLLHSQSLQQELCELYHQNPSIYASKCRRFIGREALYLPTQTVIKIADILLNENENSKFWTNRCGKDIEISHKDNLLQRGTVKKVKPEKYGLVSNERGFSFLPQFIHILFDNNVSNKKICKDALDYLGKNVDHELNSVNNFVSHIIQCQKQQNNNVDILSLFSISPNPIKTNAFPLPKMNISIIGKSNNQIDCDESNIASEWKNIHGLMTKISEPINVLLVGAPESKAIIKEVRVNIDKYFKKRQFGMEILKKIDEFCPTDIWDPSLAELRNTLTSNETKYELLILVLPCIIDGSKLKRKCHRLCLELGIKSQFINDEVFYSDNDHQKKKQMNIVFGMMSDVMYKIGASAYSVCPSINPEIIDVTDTMVFGLDVCHPTRIKSTSRPSIAVMTSLFGNIFIPNICQQKSSMFLNNNRQEICGYDAMQLMAHNNLFQQLLRSDVNTLPSVLCMLRDGVSESQIPEMVSKELTAFKLAVRQIKNEQSIKDKFENIKAWKPKIEWIVIQKRILDRFAVNKSENTMKLNSHSPAFIVASDVVGGDLFEFYLQIGQRSPKRIMFIRDEMNLRRNGIKDIAQYIYALHWLYPPCIPFQIGPLSYPAPIKFADHYANIWQEFINYDDYSIESVRTNDNLHNPQIVYFEQEEEPMEEEAEGVSAEYYEQEL